LFCSGIFWLWMDSTGIVTVVTFVTCPVDSTSLAVNWLCKPVRMLFSFFVNCSS
jgi:hypothetical protein